MSQEPSRLRVAIADPSSFGQNVLCDLLLDEGVKDIVKFSNSRDLIRAFLTDRFDLVLVDDDLPSFSACELAGFAKKSGGSPHFMALQSVLARDDVTFLRGRGIAGVLLKPIAPKRFSALFRSIFKQIGPVQRVEHAA